MIARAPAAHAQNTGQPAGSLCAMRPRYAYAVPATSARPISSRARINACGRPLKKIYCFAAQARALDKYHTVVLIFMIGGMGIGAYRGDWILFWAMVAGTIAVILYSSYTAGRQRRAERRRRRRL